MLISDAGLSLSLSLSHTHSLSLSLSLSSTKHLLDHVSRHAVEEESDQDDQQKEDDHFEDEPAVVVPEDIADRLEWVQEPNERSVRSTTDRHDTSHQYQPATTQQINLE